MENDFLLDEDDEDGLNSYDSLLETKDEEDSEDEDEVVDDEKKEKIVRASYEGLLSKDEIFLIKAYNDIAKAGDMMEATGYVVSANPIHKSPGTVSFILKNIFHSQGHARMRSTRYSPDDIIKGEDVEAVMEEEDDSGINTEYLNQAKEQINAFINYLATQDLSNDSSISKKRKRRLLPAFIIFLFSSGMYDLIIDCPTMPEEYKEQISAAFKQITKNKYDIVNELVEKYKEVGRPEVAKRVKAKGLGWFDKEPAEIKGAAEYADLNLTADDIAIYRQYRSRFVNTSFAITKEVVSDLIEVVIDKDAGISEKLKDKIRYESIEDAKREYREFVALNFPENSKLARQVIFKELK